MTNTDKLLALGAYSCGGDLIWKQKVVGRMRDGDLILTEDGVEALAMDVTDVVAKEDKPKAAKGLKAPQAPKAAAPAPAPEVPAAEPELDADIELE
jgi:hypothetical protein